MGYDRQIATVVPKDSENLVGNSSFRLAAKTNRLPQLRDAPQNFEFVFIRVDSWLSALVIRNVV